MFIVTRRQMLRSILTSLLTGLLATLVCAPISAEEPFQQMIDGLRARGYYDVALDYLVEMRTSKLLPDALRPTVSYEAGRTLIDAAIQQRDFAARARDLDQAVARLQEFLAASPSHPLAGSATLQLGNVIVERGRMALEASKRPSQQAQKPALVKQARELFAQAGQVFGEAEGKFKQKLDSFDGLSEKDPKNKAKVEARDQVRRDSIQSQMYSAGVLDELAGTYAEGSGESKKYLQEAADKYESIYQAYRRRLAGLQAHIKQGQCYRELGDERQALSIYADILNQSDDQEDFRELKATAFYLSLEAWISPAENKAELAAAKGEQWLRTARGAEDRKPQWLAARYFTALAHKHLADALKPKDPKRDQELAAAKENATRVARVANPYQDAARALAAQLAGLDPHSQQPATFAEALERGKTALDDMSVKETQIRVAPAMKLEAQIPKLQQEVQADRDRAKHDFDLAMKLRDSSTPLEDLNGARYYLCFLDYQLGRYYDAAVLGEFVARHYPDSAGARPCARIALASYLQGFNDRDERAAASREVDRQKMTQLVEFMAKHWPAEPEVEEAFAILIAVAAFMILRYGLFGVFADIALTLNVVLLLAALTAFGATLTLPGIAGIVLTMGMAVDANVLIYERIREEQRNGRSMLASIDTGFRRAMATIIDANMTHLIASLILFELGSGSVKGFAVTLGVGIITSFFTAVMVTRLIVIAWLNLARPRRLAI